MVEGGHASEALGVDFGSLIDQIRDDFEVTVSAGPDQGCGAPVGSSQRRGEETTSIELDLIRKLIDTTKETRDIPIPIPLLRALNKPPTHPKLILPYLSSFSFTSWCVSGSGSSPSGVSPSKSFLMPAGGFEVGACEEDHRVS